VERYSRQLLVKGIGIEGQKRLARSRVLLVGCGGLGTNIANILVRAGVGFIRIIDKDSVELSNLQRQSLYDEKDAKDNLPKVEAARRVLEQINSTVEIETVVEELISGNIDKYLTDIGLVMDGTDNFTTRFLINRACVKKGIPWIHGGVAATSGVVMNFTDKEGPCLECIYPGDLVSREVPGTGTVGILGTLTSVVGALQSNEAIKFLTGNIDNMMEGMLYIDLWRSTFERIAISKRDDCNCCKP
jgi:adenylyltransferase/sulfurtransferase